MKKIGLLFALIFVFFVSVSVSAPAEFYSPKPDGKYDNHVFLVDPQRFGVVALKNSVVRLENETEFEGPGGQKIPRVITGGGIVLGKYILTAMHVVVQRKLMAQTPFGWVELEAKKISEKNSAVLNGAKIVLTMIYTSKEDDIAVLKLPDGVSVPNFPYEIGNSDDLEVGNFVYIVGNPLNLGIIIRPGLVSATEAPKETEEVDGKSKNFFVLSGGIYTGDSGTPIVAVRDGRFELVGISEGVFSNASQLGFAIRINVVRKIIGECKACPDDLKNIFIKNKTR
ncbi:MAG: hypothetical protein A2931_03950 [Candidatus Niyogibacteria bacterium RIFCSPLOWO2_01_FULL_45_48]|uniref:Serine protease n=2 Tax=Candidatus Niyogiibacteriota TaxID=1817912 RepID=A0A1G2F089_9BACT|nr:MAG: hypothetical protein A2931_03950 [Candidatus Niyogibacteria bacterium RIFCSPLOWO2_01_FULL_45_48]OGZ30418.1 MAG: hypothetical protein A2835_01265 [Candidatus Niyogibacteria bacterium RIFCSPHIGHO2_01_FULL_45_28]OGZ31152.1 MAG: hypothetical protein A3J00_01215 [Candidatus Niyogibacteria bacterium RIFCSPLOWO2_02_FULL_45_13]